MTYENNQLFPPPPKQIGACLATLFGGRSLPAFRSEAEIPACLWRGPNIRLAGLLACGEADLVLELLVVAFGCARKIRPPKARPRQLEGANSWQATSCFINSAYNAPLKTVTKVTQSVCIVSQLFAIVRA